MARFVALLALAALAIECFACPLQHAGIHSREAFDCGAKTAAAAAAATSTESDSVRHDHDGACGTHPEPCGCPEDHGCDHCTRHDHEGIRPAASQASGGRTAPATPLWTPASLERSSIHSALPRFREESSPAAPPAGLRSTVLLI